MSFFKNLLNIRTSDYEGSRLETEKFDKLSSKPDRAVETLLLNRQKTRPSQTAYQEMEVDNTQYMKEIQENIEESSAAKKYTADEVLVKATEYFNGDEMVANIWMNKYALRDEKGELREMSPEDMHRRIAREFARIEQKYPNPLE
jgi:acetyl-CoA carboxylase alpha subunit